jgi:DNA-binding XRE family transcriptional regulator
MEDKLLKGIGERIKQRRKELGLTQQMFSDRFGYERVTFARLETGRRDIKSSEIIALARQLNVSCDWLLLGEQGTVGRYGLSAAALSKLEHMAAYPTAPNPNVAVMSVYGHAAEMINLLVTHMYGELLTNSLWRCLLGDRPTPGITENGEPATVDELERQELLTLLSNVIEMRKEIERRK